MHGKAGNSHTAVVSNGKAMARWQHAASTSVATAQLSRSHHGVLQRLVAECSLQVSLVGLSRQPPLHAHEGRGKCRHFPTFLRFCMRQCRLNVTFTYSMPAVGDERGKKMNATQVAVLKVQLLPKCKFLRLSTGLHLMHLATLFVHLNSAGILALPT